MLAVRNNQCFEQKPVTRLAKRLTAKDWHRHSTGDGTKGPRLYDWALIPAKKTTADGWQQGLLIRRAIADRSDLAFYLIHAPKAASLADLVQVAGRRWTIETCFEAAKSDVGLDQYEVRSWVGWHGTSRLPCSPTLTSPSSARRPPGGDLSVDLQAELLPLTVPELRRLLWRLAWMRPPDPNAVIDWSMWRRRHQQRAKKCHWKIRNSK